MAYKVKLLLANAVEYDYVYYGETLPDEGGIIEVEAPVSPSGRQRRHRAMVKQIDADDDIPIEAVQLPDETT
jgi:hypothetical protein